MALYYLVRHGEANYDDMFVNGFWGFGRDFAPLSEKGRQQAENNGKRCPSERGRTYCIFSLHKSVTDGSDSFKRNRNTS